MLEHLSAKFRMLPTEREPRAALVLNRFTRNLSIMFATNAVTSILGLRPGELLGRPFYHCIQENCLTQAIACLETAKKNESIAYLRFWFRDPRQDDRPRGSDSSDEDGDREMEDEDDESIDSGSGRDSDGDVEGSSNDMDVDEGDARSRRVGQGGLNLGGHRLGTRHQSLPTPPYSGTASPANGTNRDSFELEAVVSCTSDGLVVVLRRARPPIPDPQLPLVPAFNSENGLFAAPWGLQPIEPYYPPELLYNFQAPFLPQYMPLQEHVKAAGGPPRDRMC